MVVVIKKKKNSKKPREENQEVVQQKNKNFEISNLVLFTFELRYLQLMINKQFYDNILDSPECLNCVYTSVIYTNFATDFDSYLECMYEILVAIQENDYARDSYISQFYFLISILSDIVQIIDFFPTISSFYDRHLAAY